MRERGRLGTNSCARYRRAVPTAWSTRQRRVLGVVAVLVVFAAAALLARSPDRTDDRVDAVGRASVEPFSTVAPPATVPDTVATTSPTTGPTTTGPTTTGTATTAAPSTTTAPPPSPTSPVTGPIGGPSVVGPDVDPGARGDGSVLLVWTAGGLPSGFAGDVAAIDEVTALTLVHGDLLALQSTRNADGAVVTTTADGWGIPFDAFAVDPASYAPFQPPAAAETVRALQPGEAILTESSSRFRNIGVGGTLTFPGGSVTVSGIVDDESGGGAEAIVHRADAGRLGISGERFLLLTDSDRDRVMQRIRDVTPSDKPLSLRNSAQARWLRHGDRVEPQVMVKRVFGEFQFRDRSGRDIQIEQAWVDANIRTESVPILGRITCHRVIIPHVRDAMAELESSGKAHTVDPSKYAGCYNPRRIAAGQGLSRHTWGLALDLNIGSNPRGTYDSQDPALVQALTSRGFSWGGTWEFPDPGHYEFTARPT